MFDLVESGGTDRSNDGIVDSLQDSDLDGIPDSVDADITTGSDVDLDGIDDRFDANFANDPDTDSDGIVDSADPDLNGEGYASSVINSLTIGAALPDSNNNGNADLLEPQRGVIRTGLNGGVACSILISSPGKTAIDPLFMLLVLTSSVYLWQRRRKRCRIANR